MLWILLLIRRETVPLSEDHEQDHDHEQELTEATMPVR
jgi:hypothetical protein